MSQSQDISPANARVMLWAMAAEPIFLVAVAWLLRRFGAFGPSDGQLGVDTLLVIFSAVALAAAWASFQFASGRFAPAVAPVARGGLPLPFGQQVVAVALATVPGVLGFVHFLLFGTEWVLLVFNLGAFALAARQIVSLPKE